jgi:DNA-binding PadR family transcriptional regulator
MREPKLYGPVPPKTAGRSPRYFVQWYDDDQNGARKKQFTDELRAQLFLQEKEQHRPIDKDDLILQQVTELRKYVARGRLAELEAEIAKLRDVEADNEAEIAKLRDELASARRQTPRSAEPQRTKKFCSRILIHRPELVQALQDRGATCAKARILAIIIQQLSYLSEQGFGKVLGDGRTYIFGTYSELRSSYFASWSERTIRRGFRDGEKLGLIDSKQPERNVSRRKYYALTAEAAILAASGKMEAKKDDSKGQNGLLQKEARKAASSVQGENNTAVDAGRLYAIAATAAGLSDLAEKLKPYFPSHNVAGEMHRFLSFRKSHSRPITAKPFVDWMLRAEIPLAGNVELEPAGFSNWFAAKHAGHERPSWSEAPGWMKDEFQDWKKRGRRGRNSWVEDEPALDQYKAG